MADKRKVQTMSKETMRQRGGFYVDTGKAEVACLTCFALVFNIEDHVKWHESRGDKVERG